ncbi:alpha-ketoacid dehydrogenase subunit beta [Conexibacter sp. CPCC 206217]|uniref:alpha-ketoacid dehydrogenase subunit beta n=1 Tax=Conexibacter sp. CPCC 206217 TaxID=3064574 RepID=UPI002725D0F0|nr:alpha-ketoacid dehydrogenase subunit beta [Conexibacter sp. CPCC 206217]MDO8212601.1 alpha-ketoacid dehydrogenase subunit beta [Conexibacter sp. CPCC 206217]
MPEATAAKRPTDTLNMRWAITQALDEELERDERVCLLGQDIGRSGGVFGLTRGLWDRYGGERVRDAPISEEGLANLAVGAAINGMRPVLEIMFMDFMALVVDALANQAAKTRYLSGGAIGVPLVVRTLGGAGFRIGAHHEQSLEAWFTHVPGLKVIQPSTPADAKGLLKAAIRDEDPVVFVETKSLLGDKGPIPAAGEVLPIGKADVKRGGGDATIVATGRMVGESLRAAELLARDGISVEVVDPRTLLPLDTETILTSVAKTGNVVIVHEAPKLSGFGAEIAATIAEECLYELDAPVRRLGGAWAPIPLGRAEQFLFPSADSIASTVRELVEG